MYQTLARVFDHVSKHRERKLKNEAQPSFLTKVRGVWKHDHECECLIQLLKGESLANLCKRLITFPNPSRLWFSFILASWIILKWVWEVTELGSVRHEAGTETNSTDGTCFVSLSRLVLSRFVSFRFFSFCLGLPRFVSSRFVSFSLPFQALVQDVSHVFETLPHSPGLGEARSPADLFVASLRLIRQTTPWISARNIVRPLI